LRFLSWSRFARDRAVEGASGPSSGSVLPFFVALFLVSIEISTISISVVLFF
jgi:hypothetical protein